MPGEDGGDSLDKGTTLPAGAPEETVADELPQTLPPAPRVSAKSRPPREMRISLAPGTQAAGAELAPGDEVGDFEIVRLLGEGAFARVYLASQLSLERLVALKLSQNKGNEARTLASLEHDHIVHVLFEMVDPEHDLRLMCMQYVPGTNLYTIMLACAARPGWDGRAVLDTIDANVREPPAMDPIALRDREQLGRFDAIETVCWMGARLAEALAYAHERGVLHRDVKPANILVNAFGRPLLADFNISVDSRAEQEAGVGGTPMYMSPEHLEGFLDPRGQARIDRRSDLYGLGVVLFEWLTGSLPFERPKRGGDLMAYVRELSEQRKGPTPSARTVRIDVPLVVDRTLQTCLQPDPALRFQEASHLAKGLEGCRWLRRIERELPPPWPFPQATFRHPMLAAAALVIGPHLVGSVVNIAYNATQIADELSPRQTAAFQRLIVCYNVLIYPLCIVLLYRVASPVARVWRAVVSSEPVEPAAVDRARRIALTWPVWAAIVACLGWLPGALFFPLGISLLAERVGPHIYTHFMVSVAMSGLIAITYSYFGALFVALRVLYPVLWTDARDAATRILDELGEPGTSAWVFQMLAGVIPLVGAILLVGGGPEHLGYRAFRLLVTSLIVLGMLGFLLAVFAGDMLRRTRSVLTGGAGDGRTRDVSAWRR